MNDFLFKNSDIDTMFENCFTMPPYSRVEFLSLTQSKSGFSPKTFLNLLLTRWKDYREQVFSEYLSMGYEEVNKIYGFEFCLKIWGDEPEDFELYDYTNKDNEAVLDYSCCENENALSNFTKNEQTEVAWLNEDILFLIRDYIYKLYEFYTDSIKPIETSKINNMENDLFDNLHIYSTSIQNIPIESTTIERIIYLGFELFQEEFADAKNYTLQNALLNSKESAINVVLANLNEAISSKCGNDIDFSDVSDSKICDYSYTQIPGETSIRKKYTNIKYQPADFQLFRKIWLYRFIEEIKDVRNAICTIIEKPVIDHKQKLDMPNKNDYDIDTHAANLGHCISTATRWDLKGIKKTITDATPFSVFGTYFEKQREYFDNFKKALRLEFDNPQNGKGFEIDIKNKFYPMIKLYYDWYDKHKAETQIFEPYNFYEWIFEWTKDTENEINKYFDSLHIKEPITFVEKSTLNNVIKKDFEVSTNQVINESKLEEYFNASFRGFGENNINYFKKMVEDLELNRTPREFAQIALLIYESKQMNSRRPPHFSKWHLIFCECVGCKHVKYDPKDLRPIRKNVQSLFSYLLV